MSQDYVMRPEHEDLKGYVKSVAESVEKLRVMVETQAQEIATLKAFKYIFPMLTAVIGFESSMILFAVLRL